MVSIAGEIDNLLLYTENELKFQLQTVVLRLLQDLLLAAEFIIHKRMNLWKYHFNEKLYIYIYIQLASVALFWISFTKYEHTLSNILQPLFIHLKKSIENK